MPTICSRHFGEHCKRKMVNCCKPHHETQHTAGHNQRISAHSPEQRMQESLPGKTRFHALSLFSQRLEILFVYQAGVRSPSSGAISVLTIVYHLKPVSTPNLCCCIYTFERKKCKNAICFCILYKQCSAVWWCKKISLSKTLQVGDYNQPCPSSQEATSTGKHVW